MIVQANGCEGGFGRCQYNKTCAKADSWMDRSPYWPRVNGLQQYCQGKKNSDVCAVKTYLEKNPDMVASIDEKSSTFTHVLCGSACAVAGALSAARGGLGKQLGPSLTFVGAYLFYEAIRESLGKRSLYKVIRDTFVKEAVDDIYYGILDECQHNPVIAGRESELVNENMSIIGNMVVPADDIIIRLVDEMECDYKGFTHFSMAKLNVSRYLTDDLDVFSERNIGIVLSTFCVPKLNEAEYERGNSPDSPLKGWFPVYPFSAGVLFPQRHHKRFSGLGFLSGVVPDESRKPNFLPQNTDEMIIETGDFEKGEAVIVTNVGKLDDVIGRDRRIKLFLDKSVSDITGGNARSVHKLMQEVLYND